MPGRTLISEGSLHGICHVFVLTSEGQKADREWDLGVWKGSQLTFYVVSSCSFLSVLLMLALRIPAEGAKLTSSGMDRDSGSRPVLAGDSGMDSGLCALTLPPLA